MNYDDDLISVVVPIYNVADYLGRCLDSILINTYRNIEVICVNDGSTDNCLEILKEYSARDPRVRIIDKQNGGVSSARNIGLRSAKGAWISFVDADDWIHPRMFEALRVLAEKTDADIMIGSYVRTKENTEFTDIDFALLQPTRIDSSSGSFKGYMKKYIWGRLYRAEVLEGIHFDEEVSFGEDSLFNLCVYYQSESVSIYYAPVVLYAYFERYDSKVNTVESHDIMILGEQSLSLVCRSDVDKTRERYLIYGIKQLLHARYMAGFDPCKKQDVNRCNQNLRTATRELKKLKRISHIDKIVYVTMYRIPLSYRLWRIITDPTMLTWERQKRNNLKKPTV